MDAERHDVVWPSAPLVEGAAHIGGFAARTGDLSGRKIGFIWDYVFSGDLMFEEIRGKLAERYDGLSFVDHGVFGNVHGHDEVDVLERLPELLRSTEVDSVILGVGA
jgi:hypothetical protein